MAALVSIAAIVCGAWFNPLPPGWHQSVPTAAILGGPGQTSSWAASFRPSPRFGISRNFPRDGVYIEVSLSRASSPRARRLRTPLRLSDASILALEGAPKLPEYRFEGRYGRQYDVLVGVDFGRPQPGRRLRATADRVLRALILPRWVPARARTRRCGG